MGCRVWNALETLETLERANSVVQPDHRLPKVACVASHLSFATELFIIAYASNVCDHPGNPFTPEKLAQVVRGNDEAERSDTSDRNCESRLGIARDLTGKRRNRLFVYDRYLAILNEGTEVP